MKFNLKIKPLTDLFFKLDKKIRYVVVIIAAALIFFMLPDFSKPSSASKTTLTAVKSDSEKRLGERLSTIVGVTRAQVFITYADDGEIEYVTEDKANTKTDSEDNGKTSSQAQNEKKPVLGGDKNIIVKNRKTPDIKGVCVFYSGEDTGIVRERLYSAVKGSLGVEPHKIEVVLVK
jgi:stage III sporulation protein AG